MAEGGLDWVAGETAALRSAYRRLRGERSDPREGRYRCGRAPRLAVLVHRPPRRPAGGAAILYFHGGGWFVGSPLTHAAIGRGLARASGLTVHSLDYRLMPGHAAAAPLRDGLAAFRALAAGGHRIVLAGDSAGAAVALAVARHAEPALRRHLRGVVALYGAYGLRRTDSQRRYGTAEAGLDEPAVAALYARLCRVTPQHPFTVTRLAGRRLPAAALLVGERDAMLDDSLALAAALRAARPARLLRVPGAEHGFLHAAGRSPAADAALAAVGALARRWLRVRRR